MKRLTLILLATLLIAANSLAQNKPDKGSFGTEVQFNPFDQNGESFKLDGLKFRYFLTDKDAIRLKLGFNLDHSSYKTEGGEEEHDAASLYKYSVGDFNLDAGYERHFDLSKRLSLYLGGSIGFTRHFASTKIEEASNGLTAIFKGEIKNGAILLEDEGIEADYENLLPAVNDRAFWRLNAAIFTGIDFYVYKGLYVGTELGIGLHTKKMSEMTYDGKHENIKYHEKTADKITNIEIKTYIEPVLRLGWTF